MFNHPTLAVLWCCVCISTHLVPCAARRVVHVTHVRLKMMCCCMCAWWSSRTHTVCVTFPHHLIRSNTNVCFPWFIDTIAFTDSWSIFCVERKEVYTGFQCQCSCLLSLSLSTVYLKWENVCTLSIHFTHKPSPQTKKQLSLTHRQHGAESHGCYWGNFIHPWTNIYIACAAYCKLHCTDPEAAL